MKVRATQVCYYAFGDEPINHQRRYPAEYSHKPGAGEPFELEKPEHFSPNYMEIVEATDEERAIAEKKKLRNSRDIIDMTTLKYAPAPGVKVKLAPEDELAAKHKKRAKKISEEKKSTADEEVL